MFVVNGIFTVPPLQIVAVFALVITGAGFTVTVTVCTVPAHEPEDDVGVTVYITVCEAVLLLVMVLLSVLVLWDVVLSPVVFALSAAIHV